MPISIKEKFLKSTAVVSIFTMLSRIFGYIRDALMFIFISNASGALDAFFVAFRIPNFFRRIFKSYQHFFFEFKTINIR